MILAVVEVLKGSLLVEDRMTDEPYAKLAVDVLIACGGAPKERHGS